MKTVIIKNIEIGAGCPKICVPITGKTKEEILDCATQIAESRADMAEWRVDFYEENANIEKVILILKELQQILSEKIVLFTCRTVYEGGEGALSEDAYIMLNKEAAVYADIVDVEMIRNHEVGAFLAKEIKKAGSRVIGSNHDFVKTPSKEEIVSRLCQMETLGADIVKIAVMPNNSEDVITLLAATQEMQSRHAQVPFVTMSMGDLGKLTRIAGQTFGCAVTFAAMNGQNSAPGQLALDDVAEALAMLG